MLSPPKRESFFLFGPRGVGKTSWLRKNLEDALFFDLLDSSVYTPLMADPSRLGDRIPKKHADWIVIDEIQRIPELLNEVHRLIESKKLRFVLTGSSARKLRQRGVNLLAGRARTRFMHPLLASEIGEDFDLRRAVRYGCMPLALTESDPVDYLRGYVATYLREEVQQEGLTRNLASFARFLEAASFSQGCVLNMASIARECGAHAKVVEDYFTILEDLLIAVRLPVFTKRAKRRLVAHPKFYFFDAGVYRAVRPRGPLDADDEVGGAALETLVLQHLRAVNDYADLGYVIHYWRTSQGAEVDFVLYGERGLVAIEVKAASRVRSEDLAGLELFLADYPKARALCLYAGNKARHERGIDVVPVAEALAELGDKLA